MNSLDKERRLARGAQYYTGVVQGKAVERERIVEYVKSMAWRQFKYEATALENLAKDIEKGKHWDEQQD